ncbi:pyridoxal phosphate enzyme, YggS family [Clostridium aceticum]|uniref:Pyridoxal phosphate homeostasis protein n=1 Tax=Clostridium aceticum TaxID=84022 RepID=A0A0G3WCH0_9CLOT|nr:YggS family pyridoxal phosphate-dependent enzyme [Clostridium aceticum]AKL95560.1 pyridoxal phosphate enzyme, YggS family [Clostridium aceticum]
MALLDIENNLKIIKQRISDAATKAGRSPHEVQLIAVTKTVEPEIIERAIDCGVTDIGENKVQEIIRKYEIIGEKVKYHMIGHLQKNKVKYIIDKVDMIHSLDSYDLAKEIDKRAKKIQKVMKCLLQINISGEESKYGVNPLEAQSLLRQISELKNIQIVGLMTMAPYTDNPEEVRKYFKDLKNLSLEIDQLSLKNIDMGHLSMGMSNDFEVAIGEGANLVRIGSSIFGERNY